MFPDDPCKGHSQDVFPHVLLSGQSPESNDRSRTMRRKAEAGVPLVRAQSLSLLLGGGPRRWAVGWAPRQPITRDSGFRLCDDFF